MALCIIVAQITMVPVALLASRGQSSASPRVPTRIIRTADPRATLHADRFALAADWYSGSRRRRSRDLRCCSSADDS